MNKIIKYVIADILRNKIVLAYTVFLLVISLSVFSIEDSAGKGMLSLLNIILIIVPLVAIVFTIALNLLNCWSASHCSAEKYGLACLPVCRVHSALLFLPALEFHC